MEHIYMAPYPCSIFWSIVKSTIWQNDSTISFIIPHSQVTQIFLFVQTKWKVQYVWANANWFKTQKFWFKQEEMVAKEFI